MLPRLLVLASLVVGCGSGYPEIAAVHRFPTTADLEALDVPVAPARRVLPRNVVEDLTLAAAPALGEGTAAVEDTELAPLLEGRARLRPTNGMRCAADVLARFYLEKRALPDDAALEFVLGRCGVASIDPIVSVRVWERDAASGGEEPAPADDSEHDEGATGDPVASEPPEGSGFDGVADELGPELSRLAPFSVELGSAVATDERTSVYLGIAGRHRVATSVTRLEDGRFLIAGRLETERMRDVSAWVSQGDYGVSTCAREAGVELPELRFVCEMNRHDVTARVDLVAVPRERLTSRRLASVLLFSDAEASLRQRPQPALPSGADDPSADTASRLAALLSAARDEAGRDPAPLATAESARQAPFLPKLIAARVADDASLVRELELGFLAGWSVEGPIAHAELTLLESTAADAPTAFAGWLATPNARRALLAAGPTSVAITARETASGLTATFTLYRPHDPARVDQVQSAFREALDAARRRGGVRPFTYLDDVADLQQEADRVTRDGVHPREVLDDAMARLRGRLGRTVRCYHQEGYDPRWVELPIEFQDSGEVSAVTGVAFHHPPGAAWGQVGFFLCVFPD